MGLGLGLGLGSELGRVCLLPPTAAAPGGRGRTSGAGAGGFSCRLGWPS